MNYIKGITTRRTRQGVEVVRVHYTADPERDSEWAKHERQKYSSQGAWDREQEIVHDAGGGELLFAEILNRHADKIIIRDLTLRFRQLGSESQASIMGRQIPLRLWSSPSITMVESIVCVNTTSRGLPRR